jgi:hypothetical protein
MLVLFISGKIDFQAGTAGDSSEGVELDGVCRIEKLVELFPSTGYKNFALRPAE